MASPSYVCEIKVSLLLGLCYVCNELLSVHERMCVHVYTCLCVVQETCRMYTIICSQVYSYSNKLSNYTCIHSHLSNLPVSLAFLVSITRRNPTMDLI